jgi:hypothetical protein
MGDRTATAVTAKAALMLAPVGNGPLKIKSGNCSFLSTIRSQPCVLEKINPVYL